MPTKKKKTKVGKHKAFAKQRKPIRVFTTNERVNSKMDKATSKVILIEMGLTEDDIKILETGTVDEQARMFNKRGYPTSVTETITIGDTKISRTYKP